jgi:hypothetical protein
LALTIINNCPDNNTRRNVETNHYNFNYNLVVMDTCN